MTALRWSYRNMETNGAGKTPLVPAMAHGRKETPCAPARTHSSATAVSTLCCVAPGWIARIPAMTALVVAVDAARTVTSSDGLCTSKRAVSSGPTGFNTNAGHFLAIVMAHSGAAG